MRSLLGNNSQQWQLLPPLAITGNQADWRSMLHDGLITKKLTGRLKKDVFDGSKKDIVAHDRLKIIICVYQTKITMT